MSKSFIVFLSVAYTAAICIMLLTAYNLGYDDGYKHGVIAGYWKFDAPQEIKDLYDKNKKRTIPGGR